MTISAGTFKAFKLDREARFKAWETSINPQTKERYIPTAQVKAESARFRSVAIGPVRSSPRYFDRTRQDFDIAHFFQHRGGLENSHASSGKRLLAMLRQHRSQVLLIGDTLHDAEVAIRFYAKFGFVEEGRFKKRVRLSGWHIHR